MGLEQGIELGAEERDDAGVLDRAGLCRPDALVEQGDLAEKGAGAEFEQDAACGALPRRLDPSGRSGR